MGHSNFHKYLLQEKFGIQCPQSLINFLERHDDDINYWKIYKNKIETKLARIRAYIESLKIEIKKQKRDKERGATYLGKGKGL